MIGTGKRLEKVIDALNMSKSKFAESLRRKAQNLNIYFNGTNEVGYKTLNDIKKLFGHSSVRVTEEHYAELIKGYRSEVNLLDKILK